MTKLHHALDIIGLKWRKYIKKIACCNSILNITILKRINQIFLKLIRIYHNDTVIKVLLIYRDGNGSANWVDVPDQ